MTSNEIRDFINERNNKVTINLFINAPSPNHLGLYCNKITAVLEAAKLKNSRVVIHTFTKEMNSNVLTFDTDKMSLEEMWDAFITTTHVCGKPDIYRVWEFIREKQKKSWFLSVIMTDFDVDLDRKPERLPANTYYLTRNPDLSEKTARDMDAFVDKLYGYGYDIRSDVVEYDDLISKL